jgi:hypothetical protein
MREYEFWKHKIGREVLFDFVERECFSSNDFGESFYALQSRLNIVVRTPLRLNHRSGGWGFLDWNDRTNRFLKNYCDHVGRGKWRVNLRKKMWGLNIENCNYYIPRCNDKGGIKNAES